MKTMFEIRTFPRRTGRQGWILAYCFAVICFMTVYCSIYYIIFDSHLSMDPSKILVLTAPSRVSGEVAGVAAEILRLGRGDVHVPAASAAAPPLDAVGEHA